MKHENLHSIPLSVDPELPGSGLAHIGMVLIFIVLIILAGAWIAQRMGLSRRLSKASAILSVVASQTLGQRARIVVIEMNGKQILLGVTPEKINCLATFDTPSVDINLQTVEETADFKSLLMKILKKSKSELTK